MPNIRCLGAQPHGRRPINVSSNSASESWRLCAMGRCHAQLGCVTQRSPCAPPAEAVSSWRWGLGLPFLGMPPNPELVLRWGLPGHSSASPRD